MSIVRALGAGIRTAHQYAPYQWARACWKHHQFVNARRAHLFRGVFNSFDEALQSAPSTAPLSYDNPESARLYLERLQIDEHDYPALFWVAESLREGMRSVVDIGGAVGIKYFAFKEFLSYPDDLHWTVVDVPAVAREGRAFAEQQGASHQLHFSDDLYVADGMALFYASGALQYLDQSLPEILAQMRHPPRRLLINTMPVHERHAFFTLNSIGSAYCGYRVEARQTFVQGVIDQGYRLRSQWKSIGKRMEIIGRPEYSLDDYSGFCFDREG